jgi:hypothetical protein
VKKFQDDRCPGCRSSPFRYQENIALQRIIEQAFPKEEKNEDNVKKKAKIKKHTTTTTTSTHEIEDEEPHEGEEETENTGYPPRLLPGLEWAQESLLVFDEDPPSFHDDPFLALAQTVPQAYYADDVLGSLPTLPTTAQPENPIELNRRKARRVDNASSSYDIRDSGHKTHRPPPYEDEFQKTPTVAHKETMKQHVRSCDHDECHRVWRGPWGHFIGGQDGREYFDLTNCPVGKRLNEMIGWDYDHPRI